MRTRRSLFWNHRASEQSGKPQTPDGTYERLWFQETIAPEEVAFEAGVFLLAKARAQTLKAGIQPGIPGVPGPAPVPPPVRGPGPEPAPKPIPSAKTRTVRLVGSVPPEVWNRLVTKILPKLRSGSDLKVGVDFSVTVNADVAGSLTSDLRQILDDLGLTGKVGIQDS